MGQKVHPYGFRVGVTRPWRSRWYANKHNYGDFLIEDHRIRKHVLANYHESAIPRIEIERKGDQRVTVFIHTAKAGTLLGKKTNRLTELEKELHELTGGKVIDTRLIDIRKPELDAMLTAQRIADQISRRVNFRRASKRELEVVQQAGAKGIKIRMSGRLGGRELARAEKVVWGSVPLHTLRADVDYGLCEAHTTYGIIGVQVWINRGEIGAETEEEGGKKEERGGSRPWR